MTSLHSALKTTVIGNHAGDGINYMLVRLQNGKDDFADTLHARPNSYSTSGFQTTDFLSLLGFSRSGCAFHGSECFCRQVPEGLDLKRLSADIGKSFQIFLNAVSHLENCGLFVEQPEGWGGFYGKPATRRARQNLYCRGDGHTSPKTEKMKEGEDEFFRFVFTWIDGGSDKGWTTHYRAKHMPLSDEFQSVIDFLGGFKWFADCPEYDFEGCWWRFTPFEKRGNGFFDSNAELAHRWFDAHATHFAAGIKGLLEAHAVLEPWGLTFSRSIPVTLKPRSVVNLVLLKSYAPNFAKVKRLRLDLETVVPESSHPTELAHVWHMKAQVTEESSNVDRLGMLNTAFVCGQEVTASHPMGTSNLLNILQDPSRAQLNSGWFWAGIDANEIFIAKPRASKPATGSSVPARHA